MSSDISMPNEQRKPRRSPWRLAGVLLLLLVAGCYSYFIFQQVKKQLNEKKRAEYLQTVGPLAESFEQLFVESPGVDPKSINSLVSPIFEAQPDLAAVRVWDKKPTLIREVLRVANTGDEGILPEFGLPGAVATVDAHLADNSWVDTVGQLLLLETMQNDLAGDIDNVKVKPLMPRSRKYLIAMQQTILDLAETNNTDGKLNDVLADMRHVLTILDEDEETDLSALQDAVDTVAEDLTIVLTEFRASSDAIGGLPSFLALTSQYEKEWWDNFLPGIRGQRVLIPLFMLSVGGEEIAANFGYAEFIFFDRPGEVLGELGNIGWQDYSPLAAILLLIIVIFVWPRRKISTAPIS